VRTREKRGAEKGRKQSSREEGRMEAEARRGRCCRGGGGGEEGAAPPWRSTSLGEKWRTECGCVGRRKV
jgi:hypothetical protein